MTVATEQFDVKYKGTGVDNDVFPIPFPFRHTEALKVETIDSNGAATQKSINTHYAVVQQAFGDVLGTGTATITCILDGAGIPAALHNETITIVSNTGTTKVYKFLNSSTTTGVVDGIDGSIHVDVQGESTNTAVATELRTAILHANGHNNVIGVTRNENVLELGQTSTASYTQNSTITLSGGLNTSTEVSKTDFDNRTNFITANSQRTEFGWISLKLGTTDIIRIYREETFLQDYDYTNVAIPAEQFEKSCDRLVDGMTTQVSRDNADPSKYNATDRKIANLNRPARNDDICTKATLDSMGTAATLGITNPPAGSAHSGKLFTPSGLTPSTPAVAWASRLGIPSESGMTQGDVLSPVADYANPPYVEWTIPRWIIDPPNNGLRYVFSYGTSDAVEGEGTTKSARWREFREMLTSPAPSADVNKVIRLKDTTWQPPDAIPVTQNQGSYAYEMPNEPSEGTEVTRDLRMVAADGGAYGYSPRIKHASFNIAVQLDSGDNEFGNGDGTLDNAGGIAYALNKHPDIPFLITNPLVDDNGALVMPHMVMMQVSTVAVSSTYGGISSYTTYPVFHPFIDSINNSAVGTDNEFIQDATADGTANNSIAGWINMMNTNMWARSDTSGDGDIDKFDNIVPSYLHWSGSITVQLRCLLFFGSSTGGIK